MTTIELVAISAGNNNITAYRLDTLDKVVWKGKYLRSNRKKNGLIKIRHLSAGK